MAALPSHGTVFKITMDPVASPNVFTAVAGLVGDMTFKVSRAKKETTTHDMTVDDYVQGRVGKRDVINFTLEYDPTNTQHIKLNTFALAGTTFGLKKLAPGAVEGTTDDITCSCFIESGSWMDPFDADRTVQFSAQPTGPYRVDGVLHS